MEFIENCKNGNLIEVKKYKGNPTKDDIINGFLIACMHQRLEVVKWLYSEYPSLEIHEYYNLANVDNAEEDDPENYYLFEYDLTYHDNPIIAHWIHSLHGTKKYMTNGLMFYEICEKGDLQHAKWLYSLGVDINNVDNFTFKIVCEKGFLELAQWLYSLRKFDIFSGDTKERYRQVIYNICSDGHYEMIKWLYSIGVDVCRKNYNGLQGACDGAHINIVRWYSYMFPECNDMIPKIINQYILLARTDFSQRILICLSNLKNEIKIDQGTKKMSELCKWCCSVFNEYKYDNFLETIKKIIRKELEMYVNNVLMEFENPNSQVYYLLNDPLFEMNLFTRELKSYLFYC